MPKRDAARWMAEIPLIAVGLAFGMLFLAMRDDRENVVSRSSASAPSS